jgi:hypothetical protein
VRDLNDSRRRTRADEEIPRFSAPEYNIRTIEAAVNLPFEELKFEHQLFTGDARHAVSCAALCILR